MKKSIPVVLIVLVALTATLLAGCGNSAPTPGTAWANSEVFTYTVKDADRDNAQIATMTVTTERLSAGTYRIGAIDRDFTVSSTQSQGGGLRVKTSAVAPDGTVVDMEMLRAAGLVRKPLDGLKVLGNGELTKKLTVKAAVFSAAAKAKIEAAGGQAEEG